MHLGQSRSLEIRDQRTRAASGLVLFLLECSNTPFLGRPGLSFVSTEQIDRPFTEPPAAGQDRQCMISSIDLCSPCGLGWPVGSRSGPDSGCVQRQERVHPLDGPLYCACHTVRLSSIPCPHQKTSDRDMSPPLQCTTVAWRVGSCSAIRREPSHSSSQLPASISLSQYSLDPVCSTRLAHCHTLPSCSGPLTPTRTMSTPPAAQQQPVTPASVRHGVPGVSPRSQPQAGVNLDTM